MVTQRISACLGESPEAPFYGLLDSWGRWSRGRYPDLARLSCATFRTVSAPPLDDESAACINRAALVLRTESELRFLLLKYYYCCGWNMKRIISSLGVRLTDAGLEAAKYRLHLAELRIFELLKETEHEKL